MSNKFCMLITAVVLSLWASGSRAQDRVVTIDELFALVDGNSKSVRISETAVDKAKEAVGYAKSNRLPSLDASLSFSYLGDGWMADRDFSNGSNALMPHYGNNFSLEATQVIYAGGAIRAGIQVAELQQTIAELNLSDNRQNIRFLVLGYYLELYKLYNRRIVYKKNIEQTEMLVEHIRSRHSEGAALSNDITRYELQLEQLRLALTETDNNCRIINFQLVSTLSLPAGTVIIPDSSLLSTEVPGMTAAEWQYAAEEHRPSLAKAGISVELSRKLERVTRAGRLPSIGFVAADLLDGPIVIEVPPINKNFNYWYVGVGIKYNFGALWKSNRKSRIDRYATLEAEQNLELVREETEIAINTAYIRLRQAYQQLDTQKKSVELAVQNYNVVNNRYLNDLALITDMIDAANSQLAAELMLVNARINVVYSYYNLKRTPGTL